MFWPFKRKAPSQQPITRTLLVFSLDEEGAVNVNFAPAGASSMIEHDRHMYMFCVFIRDLFRGDSRLRKQLIDVVKHSQRLPPAVLERTVKTLEKMDKSQDVIEPDLVFPDMPHQ